MPLTTYVPLRNTFGQGLPKSTRNLNNIVRNTTAKAARQSMLYRPNCLRRCKSVFQEMMHGEIRLGTIWEPRSQSRAAAPTRGGPTDFHHTWWGGQKCFARNLNPKLPRARSIKMCLVAARQVRAMNKRRALQRVHAAADAAGGGLGRCPRRAPLLAAVSGLRAATR